MVYCIKTQTFRAPRGARSGACRRAARGAGNGMAMKADLYIAPTVGELAAFLGALPAGQKNIVFCEDRLTLEAERAVAGAQGVSFDTSVTTFARFVGGGHRVLSKQGSVLVVGGIAGRLAGSLRCFGKNPAGCAGRLYETIAQLRAALVTPEMLEEARADADRMLSEKLADIALVYREYLAFLSRGYLDESGMLALLPAAMERGGVAGANVYFVGFASFTRQAAEGIRTALSLAKSVTALLIGGEEALYTNEAAADFEKYCALAGCACERHALPSVLRPEAEALRRALFDPAYPAPVQTDRVHLFEGADAEDELAYAASVIKSEVLDRGLRYREISLRLPDLSAYAVSLEKVFGEYGIPYYADVKKSLSAHPLARFLLRWFSLLSEGFDPADADAFVGSPFFGGDVRSRELYRNYLLRYANYRGGARRPVKEGAEGALVLGALRARLLSAFEGASPRMSGAEYCRLARGLLESFGCEKVQEELAARLAEEGMLAESAFLSRGLEGILRVLAEAEELSGGEKMRAEEFSALLSEAFSALEVSLIPQYLDAVYVGDLSESRAPVAKAVIALGLTDAVPACGADTALITDRDIDRLRALKVEISPKIREVNARARENCGLALCGFSERLYLSYPLSLKGEEARPGEPVGCARALFRGAGGALRPLTRAALEGGGRSSSAAFLRYLACKASERLPAVRELLMQADAFRRGRGEFSAHTGLYGALRERGDAPDALLFSREQPPAFVPAAAQLLLRGKYTLSPTLVEGYFSCPYRNFAERGLLLAEREERTVRPLDTGDFMHELLRRLAEQSEKLENAEACAAFLRAEAEKLLSEPPFSYMADTASGGWAARALVEEGVLVGGKVYEQLAGSDFTVVAAEKTFGYPSSPFPGIPVGGGGKGLVLAGKIDRVDKSGEYARVIDYKTGAFDAGAEPYYTGRKLQLELYLVAASRGGKPAGAYYFPARAAFAAAGEEPFRMEGFTVGSDEVVRRSDRAVQPGQKSRFIDAYYQKKSKKALPEGEFEDFLRYSVLVAEGCARETERGCIAPSPYEGACDYCPYGALCGYDRSRGARKEGGVTAAEIVQIVRKRRGDR